MRTWNEIRCREMVELKKKKGGRSDTHTSVLCQSHCKLRSLQRHRCNGFTALSTLHIEGKGKLSSNSHLLLTAWRKWGLFLHLVSEVHVTSSKWKSHFSNASYHLSDTSSCSQEVFFMLPYTLHLQQIFLLQSPDGIKHCFITNIPKYRAEFKLCTIQNQLLWTEHFILTYLLLNSALLQELFPKHPSVYNVQCCIYTFLLEVKVSPQNTKLLQVYSTKWQKSELTGTNYWKSMQLAIGQVFSSDKATSSSFYWV